MFVIYMSACIGGGGGVIVYYEVLIMWKFDTLHREYHYGMRVLHGWDNICKFAEKLDASDGDRRVTKLKII